MPAASEKEPSVTPIVDVPLLDGVKVAVYTVELDAEKLLIAPPDTAISPTAKFEVALLDVKVSANVPSLVVAPSATALEPSVAVIVILGESIEELDVHVAPVIVP